MRTVLTAALTDVGVAVPAGATAENLVAVAVEKLVREHRSLISRDQRDSQWRVQVRAALQRAGRDPGSHASLDDMIAELVAVADGRLVR